MFEWRNVKVMLCISNTEQGPLISSTVSTEYCQSESWSDLVLVLVLVLVLLVQTRTAS